MNFCSRCVVFAPLQILHWLAAVQCVLSAFTSLLTFFIPSLLLSARIFSPPCFPAIRPLTQSDKTVSFYPNHVLPGGTLCSCSSVSFMEPSSSSSCRPVFPLLPSCLSPPPLSSPAHHHPPHASPAHRHAVQVLPPHLPLPRLPASLHVAGGLLLLARARVLQLHQSGRLLPGTN